ncbi:MAG: hypothetical protein M3H12_19050, partial [Chromatiales bacterium]
MDLATLTIYVKCPVDRREYRPNVTDATLAATLLTIHAQSQHAAMPAPRHAAGATAKVEKINRPTVDEGIMSRRPRPHLPASGLLQPRWITEKSSASSPGYADLLQ